MQYQLFQGGLVGFFSTQIKKYKKKDKAIEQGVQALLRNALVNKYKEYEDKEEISSVDKENIDEMHKQYENLGRKWNSKKDV